jgi:hypothetical protein
MNSAKLYLSSNVVDRLTRTVQPAVVDHNDDIMRTFDVSSTLGDRQIMDVASFMGSLHGGTAQARASAFQTPSHASRGTQDGNCTHRYHYIVL